MKLAISNLVCSWSLPGRPIIISHPEEKWMWPWVGKLPKIFQFPFNISAMAELKLLASDFKCSVLLGFAKAHHKITSR